MERKKNRQLNNIQIEYFCEQLSMILRAGISSLEGISILKEDAASPEDEKLFSTIYEDLEDTGSLSDALESTKLFPKYVIDMTALGEQTGRLDEVMTSLAAHYHQKEEISATIKNAISYPLIMIGLMALVIIVLITRVLPIFDDVLKQLGSEATGLSRGLISIGETINSYSLVFIIILVILAGLLLFFTKTKKGVSLFTRFASKFVLTRDYYEKIAACRFASCMSLMMKSGLDSDQSMELVIPLIDSPLFSEKLKKCKELMESGESFGDAMGQAKVFSGVYAKMLSIGYRTGSADEVMEKISVQYEREIDERAAHIISVLEPSLVVFLSVLVGIILLSVMLPLLGIMSNIG